MKRHLVFLAVFLCSITFLAVGVLNAATPPDKMLIENKGYKRVKKGPVNFNHKKHIEMGLKCQECHHKYVNGKNVWKEGDEVKKCAECHSPIKKKGCKVPDLKKAFHKNCMGCHKKMHKEGKISDKDFKKMKKCNSCHEKKAKR